MVNRFLIDRGFVLHQKALGQEGIVRCYQLPTRPAVGSGVLGSENTILNTGNEYGTICPMETSRKITVEVSPELLKKAQRASGAGITQTVRTGLELVAASETYARLRGLRGKVRFSRALAELKADR
jgi:hypothetical protein